MGFHKEPGLHLEMHDALFGPRRPVSWYFNNPWEHARLLGDDGGSTGDELDGRGREFVFSPEDEYVYVLAHAYFHSQGKGWDFGFWRTPSS